MRTTVSILFALAGCAHARPTGTADFAVSDREPPANVLPAGPCGFDAYLGDACTEAPSFAVVTLRTSDARAVERALRAAPRFAGYPFAESFDVIPAADASVRGVGVFAGLFRQRRDADAWARALHAEVVPLATVDELNRRGYGGSGNYEDFESRLVRVVEMAGASPAYSEADLERVEHDLDERLAAAWTKLPGQRARRAVALAALHPLCTVAAGRVFVTDAHALYAFRRMYAPVTCDDGRKAWVPWRATRLESAVVDGRVHQVILVECDVPTLETRAPGAPPAALGALTDERCD